MIEYIKEYGVTSIEYANIINNLSNTIIDAIALSETEVRKVLTYYNQFGINENLGLIILKRPDLILIPVESLEEILSKVNKDIFINIINNNIEDLILIGI